MNLKKPAHNKKVANDNIKRQMKVKEKYIPDYLGKYMTDKDEISCPICGTELQKETKEEREERRECYRCRYMDRPFGWKSPIMDDPCTCEWEEYIANYTICNQCRKCKICGENRGDIVMYLNSSFLGGDQTVEEWIKERVCTGCKMERRRREEFTKEWKKSTPQEKLRFYGIRKLRLLAKEKNIRGRWNMDKETLIENLEGVVNKWDFPIRL